MCNTKNECVILKMNVECVIQLDPENFGIKTQQQSNNYVNFKFVQSNHFYLGLFKLHTIAI